MPSGGIKEHKKPRVVALGNPKYVDESYIADFRKDFDYSVLEAYDRKTTQELLPADIAAHGEISAFIIRMGTPPYEPFDRDLLKALVPGCEIICSASAGYNEFDVDWMAADGMYFCNTVDAVAEATADMSMFLMLATLRNTSAAEASAKAGTWRDGGGLVPARDPSGMVLGIIGMGAIGKYLAKKARAFNMRIRYHNRHQLPSEVEGEYAATFCPTLHELLKTSDVISINCPLNASTTNLLSTAEFAVMKHGTFLVNTARGAIIDEPALKQALDSGKIARAGLDVFCDEPTPDLELVRHPQVIAQPHLGGLTDVAYQRAETECFENIKAYFATGKPNSPVREPKGKRPEVK